MLKIIEWNVDKQTELLSRPECKEEQSIAEQVQSIIAEVQTKGETLRLYCSV